MTHWNFRCLVALGLVASVAAPVLGQEPAGGDAVIEAKIADAASAAPASISDNATIMDWDNTVLREGTNGWTCFPTPPDFADKGNAPMCLDEVWVGWAQAWMNKTEPDADRVGIGYMLGGDTGASNSDPFATDPAAVDDWVDAGPHVMVIVPDEDDLEGVPTDPNTGGAWVMWKDTPYVHIMIPTEGIVSAESPEPMESVEPTESE